MRNLRTFSAVWASATLFLLVESGCMNKSIIDNTKSRQGSNAAGLDKLDGTAIVLADHFTHIYDQMNASSMHWQNPFQVTLSQSRKITIHSSPDGMHVYVIDYEVWIAAGGKKMLADPDKCEAFDKGESPIELAMQPKKQVCAVRYSPSSIRSIIVTPDADGTRTIDSPDSTGYASKSSPRN
jgi:hypothetical protein